MDSKPRAYIAIVVTAGILELGRNLVQWHCPDWAAFSVYFLLSLFGGSVKLRLPGITGTISAGFVLVLFGITSFDCLTFLSPPAPRYCSNPFGARNRTLAGYLDHTVDCGLQCGRSGVGSQCFLRHRRDRRVLRCPGGLRSPRITRQLQAVGRCRESREPRRISILPAAESRESDLERHVRSPFSGLALAQQSSCMAGLSIRLFGKGGGDRRNSYFAV